MKAVFLILLVGELVNLNMISKSFFLNVGLSFFFFLQPNDTRRRTLSPVVEFIKIRQGLNSDISKSYGHIFTIYY